MSEDDDEIVLSENDVDEIIGYAVSAATTVKILVATGTYEGEVNENDLKNLSRILVTLNEMIPDSIREWVDEFAEATVDEVLKVEAEVESFKEEIEKFNNGHS